MLALFYIPVHGRCTAQSHPVARRVHLLTVSYAIGKDLINV